LTDEFVREGARLFNFVKMETKMEVYMAIYKRGTNCFFAEEQGGGRRNPE
jgi:hypothetical protein